MKNRLFLLFFSIHLVAFSQKKAIKKIESDANEIEISTVGLDNIKIENSNSNFIEIFLSDEEQNAHNIFVTEENNQLKIEYRIQVLETEVFRKFITKRLSLANSVIKIPKNKTVTILGDNIGVQCENYQGNLEIYIEKGNISLDKNLGNIALSLFSGNISGIIFDSNINIKTNHGKILIDSIEHKTVFEKTSTSDLKFTVNSINANVVLTTRKTQ